MRRSHLAVIAVVAVGAVGRPAAAQQELTLRDALAAAVQGNRDLSRERISIAASEASFLAAQGAFDLQLGGALLFSRTTTPAISGSDVSAGHSNRLGYDVNLARALETGGSLTLALSGGTTRTDQRFVCGTFSDAPSECTFHNATTTLSFRHPLLRGFGAEIAQANLRKARLQKDIAQLNRLARAATVVRDVINVYWELSYSAQELTINRSAVELAREQLRFTQAQIDVGRAAPLEAAAAQRAIAEREATVALSEQALYLRGLDLRKLFGVMVDAGTPGFGAADAPTASPREVDTQGEVMRALEMNPQLKSLRMGLQLNETDLRVAASMLKPQLDFVGSVGSTGRNASLPETWAQVGGFEQMTWSAGVNLAMPIPNRAARGAMAVTEATAALQRLSADEFEATLRDSVIRSALAMKTASRRVELAKAAAGYAEQDLEAERARFSVGKSTNNEILRRQQDLKLAQIQVVRATVDLLINETNLAALTGTLLDTYGLSLR